jgi:hypothetical protein
MNAQELLSQIAGSAQSGGAPGMGAGISAEVVEELKKALTASNYQTDVATLTGGGALGQQSLDTAMKTVIQEEEHFVLFKKLAQTDATNIVDEYTRQTGVGGFLGGSTNTQMGVVRSAQGDYAREVGLVKFLMTMRQVGYVLNLGKNISEPMAVEERNGALQLLTDAEYLLFNGNAAASPTQFDGIFAQIDKEVAAGNMDGNHIINMDGAALNSVSPFTKLQAAVQDYGNWGRITETFLPTAVQTDLNLGLDPAFRWSPDGSNSAMTVGAHVQGIRLTEGVLKTNIDTFLHHGDFPMAKPFEVTWPAIATANAAITPVSVTCNAATSDASSTFTASRAGNYYYAVAAIDATGAGLSPVVKSTQTAVASGKKNVLTITQSSATTESGYAIYRSRQDGPNTTSDFRLMAIVAKGGATTTYTDYNLDIPGTVKVPCLNMNASSDAIGWRQFQPMTKIPLPFGIGGMPVMSWFQFLFGYLRVTKPKHHGYLKNILPTQATWRPFTGA